MHQSIVCSINNPKPESDMSTTNNTNNNDNTNAFVMLMSNRKTTMKKNPHHSRKHARRSNSNLKDGSRFVLCPICGLHVAILSLDFHIDQCSSNNKKEKHNAAKSSPTTSTKTVPSEVDGDTKKRKNAFHHLLQNARSFYDSKREQHRFHLHKSNDLKLIVLWQTVENEEKVKNGAENHTNRRLEERKTDKQKQTDKLQDFFWAWSASVVIKDKATDGALELIISSTVPNSNLTPIRRLVKRPSKLSVRFF